MKLRAETVRLPRSCRPVYLKNLDLVHLWSCVQILGSSLMLRSPVSFILKVSCFLSVNLFVCFRSGETGRPLCHVSESRHKDCQQRKAQRVCSHEGKTVIYYIPVLF